MQCPNCGRDYKNVTNIEEKGFFTQQNDHDHRPYRTFGYMCSMCGHHSTVFSIPTMVPFVRTSRNYDDIDRLVKEFQDKVFELSKKHKNRSRQFTLDLYPEEESAT